MLHVASNVGRCLRGKPCRGRSSPCPTCSLPTGAAQWPGNLTWSVGSHEESTAGGMLCAGKERFRKQRHRVASCAFASIPADWLPHIFAKEHTTCFRHEADRPCCLFAEVEDAWRGKGEQRMLFVNPAAKVCVSQVLLENKEEFTSGETTEREKMGRERGSFFAGQ